MYTSPCILSHQLILGLWPLARHSISFFLWEIHSHRALNSVERHTEYLAYFTSEQNRLILYGQSQIIGAEPNTIVDRLQLFSEVYPVTGALSRWHTENGKSPIGPLRFLRGWFQLVTARIANNAQPLSTASLSVWVGRMPALINNESWVRILHENTYNFTGTTIKALELQSEFPR